KANAWHCLRGTGYAVALLSCLANGCTGSKSPTVPPKTALKSVVKVSCISGATSEILKRLAPSFEAATGISVDIKTRPVEAPPDALADLWLIEPAQMPFWAARGELHVVPETLTQNGDFFWINVLPVYRSKLLLWDKEVFALPLIDEAV